MCEKQNRKQTVRKKSKGIKSAIAPKMGAGERNEMLYGSGGKTGMIGRLAMDKGDEVDKKEGRQSRNELK